MNQDVYYFNKLTKSIAPHSNNIIFEGMIENQVPPGSARKEDQEAANEPKLSPQQIQTLRILRAGS